MLRNSEISKILVEIFVLGEAKLICCFAGQAPQKVGSVGGQKNKKRCKLKWQEKLLNSKKKVKQKIRSHGKGEFVDKLKNRTSISLKLGKATKILQNWQSATIKMKIGTTNINFIFLWIFLILGSN